MFMEPNPVNPGELRDPADSTAKPLVPIFEREKNQGNFLANLTLSFKISKREDHIRIGIQHFLNECKSLKIQILNQEMNCNFGLQL